MPLDLDHLLKLRIAVARFGEMDCARWWSTQGQLGPQGALVLRRNFRRTWMFAQARSVFAVAAHRSADRFPPPDGVTLWRLTEDIEEAFDARWEHWVDDGAAWEAFFGLVARPPSTDPTDLPAWLATLGLATAHQVDIASRLRRSAENRAVHLPGTFDRSSNDVALLALAFSRGEPLELAVPWIAKPVAGVSRPA